MLKFNKEGVRQNEKEKKEVQIIPYEIKSFFGIPANGWPDPKFCGLPSAH